MNDIPPSSPTLLQRIRNYLRSDMLVLRWVFLTLYVVIVGGLFLINLFGGGDWPSFLIFWGLTFGCQALFIFVLSSNMVGDALQETLNPRLRERK